LGLEVFLRAVNILHESNGLKFLPEELFPEFFRPPPGLNPRHSGHEVGTLPLDHGGRHLYLTLYYKILVGVGNKSLTS
jgi:hypothetical protein